MNALDTFRRHDAGLTTLRRASRAAIVMPAMFAIGDKVLADPQASTFAAFGCLALLLFADFDGPMSTRIGSQLCLIAAGAGMICLGTLAGLHVWVATVATFLVALVVLFAGIVSAVLASVSTSLIVPFILPVALGGPVSTTPDRLVGWLLAAGASLVANLLLWPAPTREPLRASTARCCSLLAVRLRADGHAMTMTSPDQRDCRQQVINETREAIDALRTSFYSSPYRPTGLATGPRTLVRLVDELVWLNHIVEQIELDPAPTRIDESVGALRLAAADVLDHGGTLLETTRGDPRQLENDVAHLTHARVAMERAVTAALPWQRVGNEPAQADAEVLEVIDSFQPGFRAQEMSFAVSEVAANTERTVLARQRTWWQHIAGFHAEGIGSPLSSALERARSSLQLNSVWLHNSLRGALVLAGAVLVAEETGVQHGFWVVLGALSVLRSSALATGQNALRALVGTTVGFAIGGILLGLIGNDSAAYWGLLTPALLLAGLAPAVVSFAAGQTAFTLTLIILYNLIAPTGWQVGLVRVEDVAIGAAVGLAGGIVFWPRGAGNALARAAGDSLALAADYLQQAVAYGAARAVPPASSPADGVAPSTLSYEEGRRRAAAASRRLDDAFRGFLAEKGTKRVPLAQVTTLVTAVAALRLTADAVVNLWSDHDEDGQLRPLGDQSVARRELLAAADQCRHWYGETAAALDAGRAAPLPLDRDEAADRRLIDAIREDLVGDDGRRTAVAVRIVWTADHLDIARKIQTLISAPVGAVAAASSHRRWLATRRTSADQSGAA